MRIALFILGAIGFACGSTKVDLTSINKALTRLLENELKDLAKCIQEQLLCKTGETYPKCLDAPDGDDTKYYQTVDASYFILKIMNLDLTGSMDLENAQFKHLSAFTIDDIKSSVTVVPLGILFEFKIHWNGITFNSEYNLENLIYKNGDKFRGSGDMSVAFTNFGLKFEAHKLLGGKMDYLKITPSIDTLDVHFDELFIGTTDHSTYVTEKYDAEYIMNDIDYEKLEDYIMDFFNSQLYPDPDQYTIKPKVSEVLINLGQCIEQTFPK